MSESQSSEECPNRMIRKSKAGQPLKFLTERCRKIPHQLRNKHPLGRRSRARGKALSRTRELFFAWISPVSPASIQLSETPELVTSSRSMQTTLPTQRFLRLSGDAALAGGFGSSGAAGNTGARAANSPGAVLRLVGCC